MIDKIIDRLIMFLCHLRYKKCGYPIYCIKGTEENYPEYLLYTEDENVYWRMDKF